MASDEEWGFVYAIAGTFLVLFGGYIFGVISGLLGALLILAGFIVFFKGLLDLGLKEKLLNS